MLTVDPQDLIAPANYGAKGAPYDTWRALRAAPLQKMEPEGFDAFWPITRHADIVEISGRPEDFSNAAEGIVVYTTQQRHAREHGQTAFSEMKTIIEMDPPDHRVFRKVASGFFTPKGIERLDEIVTESARTVIDSLGDEGECDIVAAVAQRHPLRVLGTILGITPDQEDHLLELTQQLFGSTDPDMQREGEDRDKALQELGMEFFTMFNAIIEDRRANPRDDLATMLATATLPDGEPMGLMETLGYYLIVFNAGHDTTRHSLSGALEAFVEHPDQLDVLRADPATSAPGWTRWFAGQRRSTT